MSSPPPSTPADPPQPAGEHKRRKRKNKITAGAILGSAAAVAAILTLFLISDQQPQPPPRAPSGNRVTIPDAYPANVQTNFLTSCEATGPAAVCECSLSWFQQHIPISQFEQDETELEQGRSTVDIGSVEQACG